MPTRYHDVAERQAERRSLRYARAAAGRASLAPLTLTIFAAAARFVERATRRTP